jgi:hypothetical protein
MQDDTRDEGTARKGDEVDGGDHRRVEKFERLVEVDDLGKKRYDAAVRREVVRVGHGAEERKRRAYKAIKKYRNQFFQTLESPRMPARIAAPRPLVQATLSPPNREQIPM